MRRSTATASVEPRLYDVVLDVRRLRSGSASVQSSPRPRRRHKAEKHRIERTRVGGSEPDLIKKTSAPEPLSRPRSWRRAQSHRRSTRHRRRATTRRSLLLRDDNMEVTMGVQELDQKFFERFSGIHLKLETAKRHQMQEAKAIATDGNGRMAETGDRTNVNKLTIKFGQMSKLSQSELDSLYVEVLYTIRHKVGVSLYKSDVSNLFEYAQDAFRISANEHQRLLQKASQEKPPVIILNIILIEARNLIAKDANGFSDPYCMLGILTGKRRQEMVDSPRSPSKQDSEQDLSPNGGGLEKRRGSIIQRLGGSFRRKNKAVKGTSDCAIPVKLVKASSVQRATLNPKWNEKFQLLLEDVKTDRLHLDIWDHDDEGSVVDAVTKLNEISSLKGLGRYFKQVAQSARTTSDESTDDFLGCVTLRTKDVPSNGIEEWFQLEGRSAKSQVSGDIHLKLWLSTREERPDQDDEDNIIDLRQHEDIIRMFTEHELRKFGKEPSKWDGELSPEALTVLHQHAVQGDLTQVQQAMCFWLAYSKIQLDNNLSYDLLHKKLESLVSKWKPTELSKEEEDMISESFSEFLTQCYDQIIRHRDLFPVWDKNSPTKLENLLCCIDYMHRSELFKKCLPFQRELSEELPHLIMRSAIGYYERAKYTMEKERIHEADVFTSLTHLLTVINAGCLKAKKVYHEPFKRLVDVDYFLITYREFDRLLEAELCCHLMDLKIENLVGADVNSQMGTVDPAQPDILLSIFELHLALGDFLSYKEFCDESERDKFVTGDYGRWFERAMEIWLEMAKRRLFDRVDQACQLDKKIEASSSEVQYSTSYVDVCYTLKQMIDFWERLRLSNLQKMATLTERLIQMVCQGTEYYSDKLFAFLAHAGFYDDTEKIRDDLANQLCVTLNDTEQARRIVADLADKLHIEEISAKMVEHVGQSASLRWRSSIEHLLDSCNSCVTGQMEMALTRLIDGQKDAYKKHIFHLVWSPQGCPVEEAVNPLIKQLDIELITFHRWLLHRNFTRLLVAQFKAMLQHIKNSIDENPGMEPEFYHRLYDAITVLIEFFHAEGKGIGMESAQDITIYQDLIKILLLNQTPTLELIDNYYKELMKKQEEVNECKYGILNIRAYYNAMAETLVVDVIGAKHIIALDPNGLSDPFVIIEVVPGPYFKQCPVIKTKVVSKSLNPVFDETFEFTLAESCPTTAMLHFIVMDHDWMRSNDFAGEAFLELNEVPGYGTAGSTPSTLRQFNLILMHPTATEEDKIALSVLSSRKEDKEAQDFVHHIETVRNV